MDTNEMIANLAIFSGMEKKYLEEIGQHAEVLKFDTGRTIFKDREKADTMYGVLSGEVELILVARDEILKTDVQFEEYARTQTETVEREIIVDTISPGEIFGWSALTPAGQFTSKAVCAEPSQVFALHADKVRSFFQQHPDVGYVFMERLAEVISQRLAKRTDKLLDGWSEAFKVNRI
ncbi:MAG: cyclic nucleotide-binding domain-containing protein [Desulfopila sp.]